MFADRKALTDFFYAPLEWEASPDGEAADLHTSSWAEEMGLTRSPRTRRMLAAWHLGTSCGNTLPRARGEALNLVTDWVTWGFFTDHLHSVFAKTPMRSAPIFDDLLRTLWADPFAPVPNGTHSLSRALRSVMQRASQIMSEAWMARFRWETGEMLLAFFRKARTIAEAGVLDLDTLMDIRRDDLGMLPPMNVIEVSEGFEIPPLIAGTYEFRRMRDLANDSVIFQNDIFSLSRDRADQADCNTVLTLEQLHGRSTEEALAEVRGMYRDHLDAFALAKEKFMALCNGLGLGDNDLAHCAVFAADLEKVIPGTVHAHLAVVRYLAEGPAPFDPPAESELLTEYEDSRIGPFRDVAALPPYGSPATGPADVSARAVPTA
ncbi:hypothetical protein [Streptomyces sp. NPDC059247]|uniref:terpene synthase family protein n=1 Tax=Streptomyces sp. NPDC059247 TaxID=3346790 RepID=UPI0036C376C4